MAKKITFLAGIAREGSSGSVRGKIPAGLIKAINAQEGQGIEFMVHGTTLVGAKVLTAKELRIAQKEKAAEAPEPKAKATKPKTVGKPTVKASAPAKVIKGGKKPKPAVKPSKRRTEVEYEAPKVKKGKFTSKLKKKGKK